MACLFPFYVEKTRTILLKGGGASFKSDRIPVPCGKCPNCLTRRANGWAFRIMHQERVSVSSLWVTLTYDPHSVRITPNGYMTLVKRDVQLFIKRIRKAIHSDWLKKIVCFANKSVSFFLYLCLLSIIAVVSMAQPIGGLIIILSYLMFLSLHCRVLGMTLRLVLLWVMSILTLVLYLSLVLLTLYFIVIKALVFLHIVMTIVQRNSL